MNIIHDTKLREFTARQQSQNVCPITDFMEAIKERRANNGAVFGDALPWTKTHDRFRFRPGEVTVWAGINGHGKSLVMGQAALWMSDYTKILIASMEMLPEATGERMVRQAAGCKDYPADYVDRVVNHIGDNLYIYDQVGSVTPDSIIGAMHWAANELGVKHIMIDSLVKCGVDLEKNDPARRFIDALCWLAKEYKIHVHLVHHIRKPINDFYEPGKSDIKGAGEITDLADNVLIVVKNISKMQSEEQDPNEPDCYLKCVKQRHGEWEGRFAFWWDDNSHQWCPTPSAKPQPWPSFEAKYAGSVQ